MKKSILLSTALIIVLLTSCVSSKKIVYFQGADELYKEAQAITQQFDLRLKPADNILIKVQSSNPELLEVFSNAIMIGSTDNSSSGVQTGNSGSAINPVYGYTVNSAGDVLLPLLGVVNVSGLTTEEVARKIEDKIKEEKIANDPDVKVMLQNARVTVVGGVKSPGVVSLTSERNTIFDILAQCGDVADDGLKKNVKLFREVNGTRTMYTLDLTDVDIFKSPAFYVQQNDMVYVQPNKSKNIKNSSFYTFLTAGASLIGIVSSILSIIIVARSM